MTVHPTKFGFTLPQRGVFFGVTTMDRMMALAAEVDANPLFDSIWVGDSLLAKPRPDSLTLLGGLGTATRRLALGVGCMASFPVRDPIIFAYQWATLDLMSRGRMLLAACTGIVAGGASARTASPRTSRSAASSGARIRVSYKGRFRSFEDVTVMPRPL